MVTSIYLSGPPQSVNDPTLGGPADWKVCVANTFIKSGITVANPIELDLTGYVGNVDDFTNFSSVKHSLALIDRADSLLANIIQVNEAVTMEMFYAHRQGKTVVVVGNEPFSPWITFHSEARFVKFREALDYLIKHPSGFDTLTWATQYETQLKRRGEQYPPEGELDFEYYGGSIPVLVLAPHATNYFIDGNLFPQESYTGSMAVLLHKLTGCHTLISSYCLAADPIYYLSSPFVMFLSQLIKKVDIKLIVGIHGLEEWNNPFSFNLTSWNKLSLINKTEYLNLLISMLNLKDIKDIGYDSPETTSSKTKTIYHLLFEDFNIPTMRLEIHKRYRLPKLQSSNFLKIQIALSQFIMLIATH